MSVDQGVAADGFDATVTLPQGFDWREYSELDVVLDRSASEAGGATSDLDPLKKAGAKHQGDGTAYVRGEGWLTPRQIAAGDEKDFLTAHARSGEEVGRSAPRPSVKSFEAS